MAKEIKTYTAEVFLKEKHNLGESPFYDVRTKTLSWVDITEGKNFYAQTCELVGCLFTCKVDVKGLECDYCKL